MTLRFSGTVKLISLMLLGAALSLTVTGSASAAQNELPDAGVTFGPYSNDVFVEIAQQGPGVRLEAPIAWAKLSYPGADPNLRVELFDGCMDNSWDWSYGGSMAPNGACGDTGRYLTEYIFCVTDANGQRIYDNIGQMYLELFINSGNCFRTYSNWMLENDWTVFNVPLNPPTSAVTQQKTIVMAAIFTNYAGWNDPYSAAGSDRVNAFKLRAGSAAQAGDNRYVAGFVGGYDGFNATQPNAVQNRQSSSLGNFDNDFNFHFGIPCSQPNPAFALRWQDADRAGAPEGASPSDPGVSWTLTNVTTGQSVTSALMAFLSGQSEEQYIGGQGAFRDVAIINVPGGFRIQAGDNYVWSWHSIQRNNGVQFWVPYDTSEYYIACAPASLDAAECVGISFLSGVSLESDGRYYVEPNTTFRAQVQVRNSGTTTWRIQPQYPADARGSYFLGSQNPENNGTWGIARIAVPGPIAPGQIATFVFDATAPNISPTGPQLVDFDWEVVNELVTWLGGRCEADLYVTERYGVRPPDAGSTSQTFIPGVTQTWPVTLTTTNGGRGDSYSAAQPGGIVDYETRFLLNGAPYSHPSLMTLVSPATINDRLVYGLGTDSPPPSLLINLAVVGSSLTLGDELCLEVVAHFTAGWEGGPTPGDVTQGPGARICIRAAERPYLEVEGAGVWAGGAFDTAGVFGNGWCAVAGGSSNGFIRAALSGTIGAFSEYAAVATGAIYPNGFGSTFNKDAYLHFANTPASGNFNTAGRCITDYYTYLDKDTPTVGFPGGSGQFFWDAGGGNVVINGANLPAGRRITLIVNGSVTIADDITYDTAYSAGSTADIPAFILVASGNINIEGDVENLDGAYIAQGPLGINTCSDGPALLSIAECSLVLRVRGVFVANDIEFRRTFGGIIRTPGTGGGAERFEFSPELFLAEPFFESELAPDLRTSLIRDLPPVN